MTLNRYNLMIEERLNKIELRGRYKRKKGGIGYN